jgi:3-oxoacyl-[acyl-carrier protein] reductase
MNIIVTGGASGLGAAIVKQLAANPANHVYFTYNNSLERAQKITSEFSNTSFWHCNFTNAGSVTDLLKKIKESDTDILINNAIVDMCKEHFQKIAADVFMGSFEKNVLPTLLITQEAIKIFRKKKFGKIINIISSSVINKPPIGWSEYTANKAYLLSMNKSWATENIRFNITSNAISPSMMLTSLTNDMDERILEQVIDGHPLKKLLTVEEVAEMVEFFVKSSQQINGTNVLINAGGDLI